MNWNYLFKHWFSTIVFTPILIEILEYLESKNYASIDESLLLYFLMLVFGFIFSIPTYIIYSIVYYILAKKNINNYTSKLLLITITVVGILGSFYIFFNNREPKIGLQYIAISIFFGCLMPLKFKKEQ